MLHRVEPYDTRISAHIQERIRKAKLLNKQRIPLTDNSIVDNSIVERENVDLKILEDTYVRSQRGKEKKKEENVTGQVPVQDATKLETKDTQGNDDYASDDARNEVDFIGLFSCN
ncbi:hypothetical protein LXL04_023518 [Taraxacum kok-saghyz]